MIKYEIPQIINVTNNIIQPYNYPIFVAFHGLVTEGAFFPNFGIGLGTGAFVSMILNNTTVAVEIVYTDGVDRGYIFSGTGEKVFIFDNAPLNFNKATSFLRFRAVSGNIENISVWSR